MARQTKAENTKLSPLDLESRGRWLGHSTAKGEMLGQADFKQAPSYVVEADARERVRLNRNRHFRRMIPCEDLTPEPGELSPRQVPEGFIRPPKSDQTSVPEEY
ncbi:MAG: hypothetical protein GY789_07910 [Hyphomicrobiales bacterium]|nr:hypothetical protein [Hyphomicrobiales bacterium]